MTPHSYCCPLCAIDNNNNNKNNVNLSPFTNGKEKSSKRMKQKATC